MGNFAENLNLGNRFRPPLVRLRPGPSAANRQYKSTSSLNFISDNVHLAPATYNFAAFYD